MTRNTTDKLRRRVSYRWERRPPVMSPCGGTTWRRKNVALSLVLTQASNLSPCGTEQRSRAEPVRKFRSAHAAKEQSAVTSTTSNMLLSIPFWTTFGPPSPSRSLLKTCSNLCRQLYVWVSKSAVWNVGPWMDWYLLWLWLDIYCVYVLIFRGFRNNENVTFLTTYKHRASLQWDKTTRGRDTTWSVR